LRTFGPATFGPATFGPADKTADYTDKKDGTDEEKQHQCRTEGSQSVYIRVIRGKKIYEERCQTPILRKKVTDTPKATQITRIKRMAQMRRNNISVEPKVRNLCISASSAVKKYMIR
jgi:hypothetical protein